MELLIDVDNQKLRLSTNKKNIVADTQQFIKLTFRLSNDWNTLTTFVRFIQDNKYYDVYLDSNNSVYVPHEIKSGECYIGLYGTNGTIIATSEHLKFNVVDSIISNINNIIYATKDTALSKKVKISLDGVNYVLQSGETLVLTIKEIDSNDENYIVRKEYTSDCYDSENEIYVLTLSDTEMNINAGCYIYTLDLNTTDDSKIVIRPTTFVVVE